VRYAIVLMSLLAAGCATSRQNEMVWHGLNAVDAATTMSMCGDMRELNPLLGDHPNDAQVAATLVAFSIGYHYLNKWVEENHPEDLKTFQYITIGLKAAVVANNIYQLDREGCL